MMGRDPVPAKPRLSLLDKPGPWVDLALTLPIFLIYQLGVVGLKLNVRNGTDIFTSRILELVNYDQTTYLLLTFGVGAAFTAVFVLLGRGTKFHATKLAQVAIEGVIFAVLMRYGAALVVSELPLGKLDNLSADVAVVLSCGAGFHEELAFRVLLFGLGAKALVWIFARQKMEIVAGRAPPLNWKAGGIMLAWCLVAAAIFSGIHYVGSFADDFEAKSFVFRWVLGVILTVIYATRGFAAAVWSHALYDIWVMAG